eukprot:gene44540-25248_t
MIGAVIAAITLGLGFPVYLWHTVHCQPRHAQIVRVHPPPPRKSLRWVFWGEEEWVPITNAPEHRDWMELHHLAFDAYRPRSRGCLKHHAVGRLAGHFLLLETAHLTVLIVLTALQPVNNTE